MAAIDQFPGAGRSVRLLRATLILCVLLAACSAHQPPCDPLDPVLAESAFVLVAEPTPGVRATSPLRVAGCSRTFESNVVWELQDRRGRTVASGHTSGGGVDGAGPFSFEAVFSVDEPQLEHLIVFESDVSDGEGFPGGRAVVPLVLVPPPR